MKAADVMVTSVISVGPDACVQDIAHTLLTNRISAVPVIGADGKLLGIVSEGDLMRRAEAGTGRHRPWWLAMLTGRDVLAAEYVKEHPSLINVIVQDGKVELWGGRGLPNRKESSSCRRRSDAGRVRRQ